MQTPSAGPRSLLHDAPPTSGPSSRTRGATRRGGPLVCPGVVKVREAPLFQRRTVALYTMTAGRWSEIVEGADVVSEGRTDPDGDRLVYYGSTSVLLLRRSAGGELPDLEVDRLAALVRADPHVRLRVLRIARREAAARAGGPLGTLHAEIDVGASARGVSLLVEVMARLARGHPLATGSAVHPGVDAASGSDLRSPRR
jgi:hypothetical protein